MRKIAKTELDLFREYLISEERAEATVDKYIRDVRAFALWLGDRSVEKTAVLEYKSMLIQAYALASVNSVLSSVNRFFQFMGWYDLRVKNIKIQRQMFSECDRELTKAEYKRLLTVAMQRKNQRLYLLMQTICSCGIRVSELRFITVQAVNSGVAEINCKGKRRRVFLPKQLCQGLRRYIKSFNIKAGSIFVTKNGKTLDRSNIWKEMKRLCEAASVSHKKVFPHNLRHLFARTYYSIQKDVVRLADILGHSNVNTTRIYTMESGEIHRKQIQELGLLRC